MWIVEVNVLGRRFTCSINGRPQVLGRTPRTMLLRQRTQEHRGAAA